MGEARRKRMQNRKDKLSSFDFNKIEKRLIDQGQKPDYLEPKGPLTKKIHDILIIEPPESYVRDVINRALDEDKPHTRTHTPAAQWRERGESDPHRDYYDSRERHQIMGGQFTDDEIAYKCGMASGRDLESISVLHMAKERIRWLSRKLVAAEKRAAELEEMHPPQTRHLKEGE